MTLQIVRAQKVARDEILASPPPKPVSDNS